MPRPSPMLCGSEWPERVSALFLDDRELVRTDCRRVDPIRECKRGINANAGMLRCDVLLDKVVEHHLRDFDPVEGHGIDVNMTLSASAISVTRGFDFVSATEDRHERVARVAAVGDLVEIDQSSSVHDAWFAVDLESLYAFRKLGAAGREPGVDFVFREDSRSFFWLAARSIFANVIELVLSDASCGVVVGLGSRSGTCLLRESAHREKQ